MRRRSALTFAPPRGCRKVRVRFFPQNGPAAPHPGSGSFPRLLLDRVTPLKPLCSRCRTCRSVGLGSSQEQNAVHGGEVRPAEAGPAGSGRVDALLDLGSGGDRALQPRHLLQDRAEEEERDHEQQ